MSIKIMIPTPLRQFTNNSDSVSVEGQSVSQALNNLCVLHAPLRRHLYADDGKLRSFVNVYVNDEDIRYLQKEQTVISDEDILSIIPSIAGGVE